MKIVNRQTFLRMPSGTVFCKGKPWYFDSLCVKRKTVYRDGRAIDFMYQDTDPHSLNSTGSSENIELLDHALKTGRSIAMDLDCQSRDGCFDDEDLFAIYEPGDLAALIDLLTTAKHEVAS